jgi:hypothetical protein
MLLRGSGTASGANQRTSAISSVPGTRGTPVAIAQAKEEDRETADEPVNAYEMLDLHPDAGLLVSLPEDRLERALAGLHRAAWERVAPTFVVFADEEQSAVLVADG